MTVILILLICLTPVAFIAYLFLTRQLDENQRLPAAIIALVLILLMVVLLVVNAQINKRNNAPPVEEDTGVSMEVSEGELEGKEVEEAGNTIEEAASLSADDKRQLGFSPTVSDKEISASLSADPSKRYIIQDYQIYSIRDFTKEELDHRKKNPGDYYSTFVYGKGKLGGTEVYYFKETVKGSDMGNIRSYPSEIVEINHIDNSYVPTITKKYKVVNTASGLIKQLIGITANIPADSVMEEI